MQRLTKPEKAYLDKLQKMSQKELESELMKQVFINNRLVGFENKYGKNNDVPFSKKQKRNLTSNSVDKQKV